jgi:predicted Rossmann fold nucleotide-binding protein DprA/Smf involved in DNA uptake
MAADVTIFELRGRSPDTLRRRLAASRLKHVTAIGNPSLLDGRLLAFICSSRCPGNVILDVYDLARELRNAAVTVIGGFHSPMERECLELLMRGTQPIIICPARSLQTMRIAKAWHEAMESGRLLLLSPFPPSQRTVTADSATRRNRFVAQIADEILVAHAAAGGKTEAFCRELLGTTKPLLTIDRPENRFLLDLGAEPLTVASIRERWPYASGAGKHRKRLDC